MNKPLRSPRAWALAAAVSVAVGWLGWLALSPPQVEPGQVKLLARPAQAAPAAQLPTPLPAAAASAIDAVQTPQASVRLMKILAFDQGQGMAWLALNGQEATQFQTGKPVTGKLWLKQVFEERVVLGELGNTAHDFSLSMPASAYQGSGSQAVAKPDFTALQQLAAQHQVQALPPQAPTFTEAELANKTVLTMAELVELTQRKQGR